MKAELSTREIFLKVMAHEPCCRTLKWSFGFWGGTLNRWYEEDLPRVKGLPREVSYGEPVLGSASPYPATNIDSRFLRDFDVSVCLDFDEGLELVPLQIFADKTYPT